MEEEEDESPPPPQYYDATPRISKTQLLLIDLVLLFIVAIITLCCVLLVTLINEHQPKYAVACTCWSLLIFYFLSSSTWTFKVGVTGSFSEHTPMLFTVSYWLLWQLLVCSPSVWDRRETDDKEISTQLSALQPILRLILFCICEMLSFRTVKGVGVKVGVAAIALLMPFLKNDGFSTDEIAEMFQFTVLLFNYGLDFMITKLGQKRPKSRLNAPLQALWCFATESPLLLVGGTISNLLMHLVGLLLFQKTHTN
jgi:hypothetical protein